MNSRSADFTASACLLEKTERTGGDPDRCASAYAHVGEEDLGRALSSHGNRSRHDHRPAPGRRLPAGAARARGSVHHIAFRAKDDAAQVEMAAKLAHDHGMRVTEQKDRNYFRSVYFREPGGVLFEIATDVPGFAVDEPAATLGRELKLPKFLESRRGEIEARLPALETA